MPIFKIKKRLLRYLAGLITAIVGVIVGAGVLAGILYGLGIPFRAITDAYYPNLGWYFLGGFMMLLWIVLGGCLISLLAIGLRAGTEKVAEKLFDRIRNSKLRYFLGFVCLVPYCVGYCLYAIFYLGLYKGARAIGEKCYDP